MMTLSPKFRRPTFRLYRTAMYVGLGLSALVFAVHGIMLHGLEVQTKRMSLDRMALMAALNLIGASVYTARVYRPIPREFVGDTDCGIGSRTMVSKEIRYTWQQPSDFPCHGHSCRSGALGRSVTGFQFRPCTGPFV